MRELETAGLRCAACGAELAGDGEACEACARAAARPPAADAAAGPGPDGLDATATALADDPEAEAHVLAEVLEREACAVEEPECARTALWLRAAASLVYALVCAACVYGSISFFRSPISSWTDWIFGAMAIGLALIAVLGIKESLFPSAWTPE